MGDIYDNKIAETDARVDSHKNKAKSENDSAAKKASGNTTGIYGQQVATEKESLDPNVNANQAKGQGQYGMFNNRDYSTTLRLAREADRYNNQPMGHAVHQGHYRGSGIHDMGTLIDKPKIQTMETRAMEQTQQLDTNQKMLAQQLQADVNRKDLNAFIQHYQQLYGIELSRFQAEQMFTQLARSMQMQQAISQGMQYFQRAFSAETASAIHSLNKSDPELARMLGNYLTSGAAIPQQLADQIAEEAEMNAYYDALERMGTDHEHASAQQQQTAMQEAQIQQQKTMNELLNRQDAQTRWDQKWTNRRRVWKDIKAKNRGK